LTVEEDDVRDADEGIVLSDREREALAGLADSIGDPWLAGQLAGREPPVARPKRRRSWPSSRVLGAAAGWIGLLLIVAGAALAITSFMHSTVVASLGLVVMGVGVWRFVVDRGDGVVRLLKAAGASRRGASDRHGLRPGTSAAGPPPPRIPPEAE
jgi:hypothetical protein